MFERYTEKARRTIFFARYEASQFGCSQIETEHLLLGVFRENKALASQFGRAHLMRMLLSQGMRPVFIGLASGLTIAPLGSRVLASQLYGIAPNDALTIAGVAILLLIVALFACWLPARRAMRIDPLQALRFE